MPDWSKCTYCQRRWYRWKDYHGNRLCVECAGMPCAEGECERDYAESWCNKCRFYPDGNPLGGWGPIDGDPPEVLEREMVSVNPFDTPEATNGQ